MSLKRKVKHQLGENLEEVGKEMKKAGKDLAEETIEGVTGATIATTKPDASQGTQAIGEESALARQKTERKKELQRGLEEVQKLEMEVEKIRKQKKQKQRKQADFKPEKEGKITKPGDVMPEGASSLPDSKPTRGKGPFAQTKGTGETPKKRF